MNKIYFTVNGEHYSLSGGDVSPTTTLNEYLRNYLSLHGTKAMCHEGGCGACVVSVSQTHPVTKEKHVFAVNSCLVLILSCHQWDIVTVEGVGNRRDGYHPIQTRLAAFNGTQCGYCTPGWVMNMYSLYSSSQQLSTMEIENSFAGNMCRCTGYRPILDAFKTFAVEADDQLNRKLQDLEDLHKVKCSKACNRRCSVSDDWCVIENKPDGLLDLQMKGSRWYKAYNVQDVFKILSRGGIDDYTLVAGNTGKGVYPPTSEPRIQIDISSISSLKATVRDENLVVGAGTSLTDALAVFRKWARNNDDFTYLELFYQHLLKVAHLPVRNVGTIAGNLAMKNKHPEFPSDVFILLETVQATVTILNSNSEKKEYSMQHFLKEDLKNKLILDVKLPPLSANNLIRTYKIMPRAQNAHAVVNAGFLFKVDSTNKITSSKIVYGAISPSFVRATGTEKLLTGSDMYTDETLQKALNALKDELNPVEAPPEPSPACRKDIALGLFYKAFLSLSPSVNPRYVSGGGPLGRGVSRGTQAFDTDKTLWPVNEPVPKLEALSQCAGEVQYSCDEVRSPRHVHLAFVLSTVARATLDRCDAEDALKIPGVISFMTAKDIPGKNCFTPTEVPWQEFEEEILASEHILYHGQPVGLIAATTHDLALKAAAIVKVFYKDVVEMPVLTVKDALRAPDKDQRVRADVSIDRSDSGTETTRVIKGSYNMGSQYHYTMESQCCSARVTQRGVRLRAATQWMDLVHVAVARTLALPLNVVEVYVGQVGGGYGGKASRSALVACACALAAHRLQRPASLVLPLTHNMAVVGKRAACEVDYEIGINDAGMIQYLDLTYYSDCGCCYNDSGAAEVAGTLTNLYQSTRWKIRGYSVLTDKPSNTWCRAPSTTEGTAIIEHIMERISHATDKDPIQIRIQHLSPKHTAVEEMIDTFKNESKYDERKSEIDKFNSGNAWKKRGLKLSIMSYPIEYSGNFPVVISVYHADGSVAISHGGIEMGQGINTKVAQVCAHVLKVPLEKVTVKGSDNMLSPNAMASNGSITSESVAHAVQQACRDLLRRLQPDSGSDQQTTWEQLVKDGYDRGVNLQASYMTSPRDKLVGYSVYGVCAVEVELDVLTGNHVVRRADLLEDTGVSISPEIDVGQIEGAFVMGLGLWTSEHVQYSSSGRLLTDSTWTYKPPGARDIPLDFRVSFRRNSANTAGVLRSKATGEPALTLAVVVTHALHDAILSARKEFGYNDTEWLAIENPYSMENILKAISPDTKMYRLK